jgi:phosphocarrier protein FPr
MVGIVIVSHSYRIAEGVAELAREMGGADVRLETAGGLDTPDHPIGTDAVLVMQAIERAWSDDGVLVLMDLGSAVLSAEMALDLLPQERRTGVELCEAPLVEGAVAAAVTARMGAPLASVAREARGGLAGKVAHLGTEPVATHSDVDAPAHPGVSEAISALVTVRNPHGLHARPAARLVQTATAFDAQITVRNVSTGRGPAAASSLNAIATLGVAEGDEIEIVASGPQAGEAIEALTGLAKRNFDEEAQATAPSSPSERAPEAAAEPLPDGVLRGFSASPGLALGPARRFHAVALEVPPGPATDEGAEIALLDRSIESTAVAIIAQRDRVAAGAGEQEAAIFDAHLLFLRDEALLQPAHDAIRHDHRTAAQAWQATIERSASAWDAIEDGYLRARAADLRSVGDQVLAAVLGVDAPAPRLDAPGILVAIDLTPADTAALDPAVAIGMATARGGPTSHAAVLARSLGIPAVVGIGDVLLAVEEGTLLALDGDRGQVNIEPAAGHVERLEAERAVRERAMRQARARAMDPAVTEDGTQVEVAANVGRHDETAAAVAAGADAIGLFRTEFLFMDRDSMPDEDEQEAAYRAAAVELGGRPLLLRTLDAGADKPLPYLRQPAEPNPFLGVRGVRLGLERPELLRTQLRAVLKVAADHPIRVMFPMVSVVEELLGALSLLRAARDDLDTDAGVETGIMIEVPSAALTASTLAASVDFFSIGTNDLTQYTLAADRGNERVAGLSDALHPAVLRLIHEAVAGAAVHDRWVGVCGEVAADPGATALLLGLGVRELSMSALAIAAVKNAVRSVDLPRAEALADRARACGSPTEVRSLLAEN